MSTEQAESHVHLAKDGLYYKSYEEKRKANIRYNESQLMAKGLDSTSFRVMNRKAKGSLTQSTKQASRTRTLPPEPVDPQSLRRSGRIRKTAPEHSGVNDELDNHLLKRLNKGRQRPEKTWKRIRGDTATGTRVPHLASTLTPHQKQRLESVKWLDEFEHFLKNVQVVSQANARSVLKQVNKLVAGEGIVYSRWPAECCFAEGRQIRWDDDLDTLYEEAIDWEDKYGRDLGNGWLLRHPIKKLAHFQEYFIEKYGGTEHSEQPIVHNDPESADIKKEELEHPEGTAQ